MAPEMATEETFDQNLSVSEQVNSVIEGSPEMLSQEEREEARAQERAARFRALFSESDEALRERASTPANLKVSGSARSFEKKHGMYESAGKRFIKKKILKPIGRVARNFGDLAVKSLGQAKMDWFRIARLQFSDKHSNYSYGVIPWFLRFAVNFGGSASIVSLILAETPPGKAIINYRKARRNRIDRMKNYIAAPFRGVLEKISRALPWHKERYNATQNIRGAVEKLNSGQAKVENFMYGGITGVIARMKRRKMLKQRQEKRKSLGNQY